MSLWHGLKARRTAVGLLAVAALTVSLVACGGGDGGGDGDKAGSTTSAPQSAPVPGNAGGGDAGPSPTATRTLATLQGADGIQLVIQSAVRDQGGFLTVSGVLTNTTGKVVAAPVEWSGEELQVRRTGRSLAGMTLADEKQKKRYYVLRDTDGYPLATTLTNIAANATIPFYAQFPAPPVSTTQVAIQLPTMNTATIAIS